MNFRVRHLVLAACLVCAWPGIASAQWASTRIEHDWRMTIGGSSIGLVQRAVYFVDLDHVNHRETIIYLGPFSTITTRFRADHIAVATLAVVGMIAAFVVCKNLPRSAAAQALN